jgi:6-pyruvoyltetrahydropterin/6-carboxytetrahydropterin synthase
MSNFQSTKLFSLGSCAFRQPFADSHCRWLHGYRLQAKFWFGCDELDTNNWVVDFGGLKGLRRKFERQFDHTTCISKTDPALPYFQDLASDDICDLRIMDGVGIEKFAEWCFDIADHHVGGMTRNRCWVDRVEVFEHKNNSAAYNRPHDLEGVSALHASGQQELDLRLEHGEPLKQPSIETTSDVSPVALAEDIATESDKKQEAKKSLPSKDKKTKSSHPTGDPKQHKGNVGQWVDPDKANKPNSWIF